MLAARNDKIERSLGSSEKFIGKDFEELE